MKQRSEWSKVAAPMAFGLALTMVLVSCGKSSSPTAPSASAASAVQANETPVEEPTPPPEETPTPTPGGEGCTPGYWKAPQHFDSWVGYSPNQLFSSVFVNAFPGKTLVQVAALNGGGLNALGRHTVAALLSASNDDVSYPDSVEDVIALFNEAYDLSDYERLKNRFEAQNEAGCPLD
jgi:hypothetical protein